MMKLLSGRSRYLTLDNKNWYRPLLVVLPLLLSALVATQASARQLMFFPAAGLAVGAVVVFLRWPPMGLIVTAVAGLFVPFSGPGGLNVTVILVAGLFGLWVLDMIVRKRAIRVASSRTLWPLLAFVAAAFLSFGFGHLPWFTIVNNAPLQAQLGGLAIVVLSAVAFLLVANQINNLAWLSRLTWAFLAFATISFVLRTAFPLLGLPTRDLLPSVSIGSLFYVWLVVMAFSQALFNRDLPLGWRIALASLVLIVIFILSIFKFADKSGWLPAAVALGTLIAFRSRLAGFGLVLGALLLANFVVRETLTTDSYSISTRFDAWLIMAQLIAVSPMWGLGFANYYSFTTLIPIRGYYVQFNSHNNFVDIVAQMGVVGMACFLWFFWEVGRLGWQLREQAPNGFARAYVYGALAGLVGTAVAGILGDWVLPFVYNIGLNGFRSSALAWIFLGGLLTIEQVIIQEKLAA